MSTPRILVVGDGMTDVYHCGSVSRISPEAPIPVVKIEQVLQFPGGAANIAQNLLALGARVDEYYGDYTCIKNRLMVGDTQLARWDQDKISMSIPSSFLPQKLQGYDAIVVGDYHKGSIMDGVLRYLEQAAAQQMPIFVDTKEPQVYPESCIFFPNAQEFAKGKKFYRYLQPHQVVITRGPQGFEYKGSLYPTRARFVRSVIGAGDTFTAAFVYAYVMNECDPAGFANLAAGIAVEKPYTSTVSLKEIQERDV